MVGMLVASHGENKINLTILIYSYVPCWDLYFFLSCMNQLVKFDLSYIFLWINIRY